MTKHKAFPYRLYTEKIFLWFGSPSPPPLQILRYPAAKLGTPPNRFSTVGSYPLLSACIPAHPPIAHCTYTFPFSAWRPCPRFLPSACITTFKSVAHFALKIHLNVQLPVETHNIKKRNLLGRGLRTKQHTRVNIEKNGQVYGRYIW